MQARGILAAADGSGTTSEGWSDRKLKFFPSTRAEDNRRPALLPLLAYFLVWAAVGAAVAFAATSLIDGEESVTLPPVQETQLTAAATKAGCVLLHGADPVSGIPTAGSGGTPATPGIYDDPPADTALVAALRRGVIVIHYRPQLSSSRIEQLGTVQEAVPQGTILTPNREMPYALAVTAWRRLLGCERVGDRTLDAVRLFRGRYIGWGPDVDD
jgi:hypothetical protein